MGAPQAGQVPGLSIRRDVLSLFFPGLFFFYALFSLSVFLCSKFSPVVVVVFILLDCFLSLFFGHPLSHRREYCHSFRVPLVSRFDIYLVIRCFVSLAIHFCWQS